MWGLSFPDYDDKKNCWADSETLIVSTNERPPIITTCNRAATHYPIGLCDEHYEQIVSCPPTN